MHVSEELTRRDAATAPAARAGADIDATAALDALEVALVGLSRQWRIALWNAAAERATGLAAADLVGEEIWTRFPALADSPAAQALREAMERREPRAVRGLRTPRGEFDLRIVPAGAGLIVQAEPAHDRDRQQRELAERGRENDALRDLARQLAEVSDSGALLEVLCGAAAALCGADGAAVAVADRGDAAVVTAVGVVAELEGRRYTVPGAMGLESIVDTAGRRLDAFRDTESWVRSPEYQTLSRRMGPGPTMIVPLVAHERMLGVLAVVRREGAPLFGAREGERLEAIGDHAALALWKSHLLEEAEGATRAQSNFLATISHELRTPLTALTGYGELLADEILGPMPKPQHEVIDRMRSVTHQLSAMIDEILTFSSLEAGKETARLGDIDAAEIVRAAVAVVEPLAQQKGVAFALELPRERVTMLTDGDKVRQILVNLAGNAVKFTDRGSVSLVMRREADDVVFTVTDTGIGISAADRPRLFQPFTQLDSSLTRRHGGTGLGLYISIRLARLLGGRIDVESEPGRGSVFTLTVPVRVKPG